MEYEKTLSIQNVKHILILIKNVLNVQIISLYHKWGRDIVLATPYGRRIKKNEYISLFNKYRNEIKEILPLNFKIHQKAMN